MLGRPAGSKNKVDSKPFKDALRKALISVAKGDNIRRLDRIAIALLIKAEQGDVAAIREVMDRTDGKVAQAIGQDNELGPISVVITGVPRPGD